MTIFKKLLLTVCIVGTIAISVYSPLSSMTNTLLPWIADGDNGRMEFVNICCGDYRYWCWSDSLTADVEDYIVLVQAILLAADINVVALIRMRDGSGYTVLHHLVDKIEKDHRYTRMLNLLLGVLADYAYYSPGSRERCKIVLKIFEIKDTNGNTACTSAKILGLAGVVWIFKEHEEKYRARISAK